MYTKQVNDDINNASYNIKFMFIDRILYMISHKNIPENNYTIPTTGDYLLIISRELYCYYRS